MAALSDTGCAMINRRSLLLGGTAVIAKPLLAQNDTPSPTTVLIEKLSLDDFMKIVQAMGFECHRNKDEKFFTFRAQGYKVAGFSDDGETDLMLYAAFSDMRLSLDKINEWNLEHRFVRAYSDSEKNPTLTYDLNLDRGISRSAIEKFLALFRDLVAPWATFCQSNNIVRAAPAQPSTSNK